MMVPSWQGVEGELADSLGLVALQVRAAAEAISQDIPQVRVLDLYALGAVSWHEGRDGIFTNVTSIFFLFFFLSGVCL